MSKMRIKNPILRMILRKILKKEVIEMKKLLMLLMAFAMVAAFVPMANAADSAQLSLQVTFAPSEPLKIWTEPEGPFEVKLGETLKFEVIAADKDSAGVEITPVNLNGGEWTPIPSTPEQAAGIFKWATVKPLPDFDNDGKVLCAVDFMATNREGDTVNLHIEFTLIMPPPTIAIELEGPNPWALQDVKLGEIRANIDSNGVIMHKMHNTGNVAVAIGIRYIPYIAVPENPRPGTKQGPDTFITMVNGNILPLDMEMPVFKGLAPQTGEPVPLSFGAPTALSFPQQARSASAAYEFRAYKAIEPGPYPLDPIVQK